MLPAARHDFGQNEAMRCTGQRSALHQPLQHAATGFAAHCVCCISLLPHSLHPLHQDHPPRPLYPSIHLWAAKKQLRENQEEAQEGKALHRKTPQKPIGQECPQTLGDGGRSIIPFPQASTPEAQAACIVPCKKHQESNRQNDWPVEAFLACFRFTMAHFQQLGEKSRARGL